ncbi:MAG: ATP-grasp domain-containing protein [Proteobacteria bacterium]|nr:ATP-grasp domain-containing protein [Pseudomonadota bacterium]
MPPRAPVAILYQALPPPEIGGLRKDAKPGGYSDSGADIGFCLKGRGVKILTPVAAPDPTRPMDWVFPDTHEGIQDAIGRGAGVLWANTVLFEGHPLERVMATHWIVGQPPAAQQSGDDKFATNTRLRANGLPLPASLVAGRAALRALTPAALRAAGLDFPLVVKPIRGRGSQGVSRVRDLDALLAAAEALIASARFGDTVMIEQYLSGAEMTVTVLPTDTDFTALPPVLRFNHHDGVAPYNGVVAVTQNSRALTPREQAAPAVTRMLEHCIAAARLMQARAPIRIDCRGDGAGEMRLFDLNMKPNLTGAGRPGREDQDSLSTIAARAMGWSYGDLLCDMLAHAWMSHTAP